MSAGSSRVRSEKWRGQPGLREEQPARGRLEADDEARWPGSAGVGRQSGSAAGRLAEAAMAMSAWLRACRAARVWSRALWRRRAAAETSDWDADRGDGIAGVKQRRSDVLGDGEVEPTEVAAASGWRPESGRLSADWRPSDTVLRGTGVDARWKMSRQPVQKTKRRWRLEVGSRATKRRREKTPKKKRKCKRRFDAVVHFAGLKAVGESVQKPLLYYDHNVAGTINLLEVMAAHGCKKLVFSSSAAVYGSPKNSPCTEEFPLTPHNPYGKTKLIAEDICRDIYHTDSEWRIILLRYFNPVGAHPSGYLGEDPCGIPNNLMPFVQQVAVGRRSSLTIFGNNYATKDGTGVRDYIHVVDLAEGHIAALRKLFENPSKIGCEAYNLGTGKGTSVLEIVNAFEKASGKKIPLVIGQRRPGDAEILFAATAKAERELNWKAKYGITEMCRDQWNWASKNPYGYASPDSTKQNGNSH